MVTPHQSSSESEAAEGGGETRALLSPMGRASGFAPTDPPLGLAEARELSARSLQAFGLTPREARLYLVLLRAGPVPARTAIELSGLQRATTYRLLGSLLSRGLVRTDGRWPRSFHPLPAHALYERMEGFFADEIELRKWLDSMHPNAELSAHGGEWPAGHGSRSSPVSGPRPSRNFASWLLGGIGHPLGLFHGAARRIDALLRPATIPARARGGVAAALLRAIRRGCRVRLVLDCNPSDNRFVEQLRRESGPSGALLELRRYTPLPSNLAIVDGKIAFRFPGMGASSRCADCRTNDAKPGFHLDPERPVRSRLGGSGCLAARPGLDPQLRVAPARRLGSCRFGANGIAALGRNMARRRSSFPVEPGGRRPRSGPQ